MRDIKIKICGMTESLNIREVVKLEPDLLGFIFYPPSPRYMAEKLSGEAVRNITDSVQKTGVFVNADIKKVMEYYRDYGLDCIQLHGSEKVEYCRELQLSGISLIKAFSISEGFSFRKTEEYMPCCDYFLFDTRTSLKGGSGKKFQWEILANYDLGKPFFLSGGISPADKGDIKTKLLHHPSFYGVDLNSRFELSPGIKDADKLRRFINDLRSME